MTATISRQPNVHAAAQGHKANGQFAGGGGGGRAKGAGKGKTPRALRREANKTAQKQFDSEIKQITAENRAAKKRGDKAVVRKTQEQAGKATVRLLKQQRKNNATYGPRRLRRK